MRDEGQLLPVRLYQTEDRLMIAVPMPGLEPGDVTIDIEGDRVRIRGEERGPHQHERDLLIAEWTVGPYFCEVELPQPVNGRLTNASYDNGVLVLSMPKVAPNERGVPAEIRLEPLDSTRGQRVGHRGRDIRPAGPEAAA
jgi:HSP20 family protein